MNNLGELIPRAGIGKIKLGADKSSIINLLGSPIRENQERRSRTSLDYDGFNVMFSEDSKVESIEVYPKIIITYKGNEIFKNDTAWKQLIIDDGNPFHISGTIVLLNLGVSMWEDPNEEEQDKSFVVSIEGAWDRLKNKLKPYESKII